MAFLLRRLLGQAWHHNGITIVSGLPRSGTSLMMQMLHAGGCAILTDSERPADDNNPKGYYEFAPVKGLGQSVDAHWITEQAQGKAVKIVSPLLHSLPPTHQYRVIFMQRHLDEILDSQHKMRGRLDQSPEAFDRDALRKEYQDHLTTLKLWLNRQPNIAVCYVNYTDLLNAPQENVAKISTFLGGGLNLAKMISAIDPKLYRERQS